MTLFNVILLLIDCARWRPSAESTVERGSLHVAASGVLLPIASGGFGAILLKKSTSE
jgi:hypothetical protein